MSAEIVELQEDQKARWVAQSEFSKHIVVEAGAGTGKTATLIARIVFWSLTDGWQKYAASYDSYDDIALGVAEGVASITFTENAVKEMAERLGLAYQALVSKKSVIGLNHDELQQHFQGNQEEIAQRSLALLGVCSQFQIQTIHSFCNSILTRFPRQSKLHLSFTLDAEQDITERFIRELILEDLQDAYHGSKRHRNHYRHLLAKRKSFPQLAGVLRDLLAEGVNKETLLYQSCSPANTSKQYREIQQLIELCLTQYNALPKALPARSVHNDIKAFLEEWQRFFEEYDEDNASQIQEELLEKHWLRLDQEYSTAETNIKKKTEPPTANNPRYPDTILDLTELFQDLYPRLKDLRAFSPYSLNLLQELFGSLLPRLQTRLRQKGVLGFNDLLRNAKDLLQSRPAIAKQCAANLDLLMVDEFQDTSEVQCQFLDALVFAVERTGAQAPRLFIVGDPKQSIYGWRQADIASYFSFVQKVIAQGGLKLSLVLNYRSTPRILEEVSAVFAPIMHRKDGFQPAFVPLIPNHKTERYQEERDQISPIEYWISWGDPADGKSNTEACRKNQAKMIVEDILKQKESKSAEDFSFSDFAVLFRSKSDIDLLITVLQEKNCPYVVSGGENFYRRKEIIDTASFLLTLFEPSDQVALVGLLRSKMVGLPDLALYPLWMEGFPQFFLEAALRSESDTSEKLEHFCAVLQKETEKQAELLDGVDLGNWIERFRLVILICLELRKDMQILPTDLFFNKLRRRSLVEVLEASMPQASYRLNNLELFFLELFEKVEQSSGHWADVLLFLRTAIQNEEAKKEASLKDFAQNSVQIMSMHKAKGLDFKQVYIVDLERAPAPAHARAGSTILKEIDSGVVHSLLGASSFGVQKLQEKEKQRESYERVRVLYVAMTRAKERLVLIGNFVGKKSSSLLGRPVSKATSFMGLLFAEENENLGRLQALSEEFWSGVTELENQEFQLSFLVGNLHFRRGFSEVEPLEDKIMEVVEFGHSNDAWEKWKERQVSTKLEESKRIGERNSSLLNLLRAREFHRNLSQEGGESAEVERAYQNLVECQNLLLFYGGISLDAFAFWRRKIEQELFDRASTYRNVSGSLTLLSQLQLPAQLSLPELQFQGEILLLDPMAHHAQRQEYWIQGILEREEEYLLVELVWDWKKIQQDLNIQSTEPLLIHTAAKELEKSFPAEKPFRPAFFDLANNELIEL